MVVILTHFYIFDEWIARHFDFSVNQTFVENDDDLQKGIAKNACCTLFCNNWNNHMVFSWNYIPNYTFFAKRG